MPQTMTDSVIIGVDIGGTFIKSVALSSSNKVLLENKTPSRAAEGPEAIRNAIRETIAVYQSKEIKFSKIGVGCAGSVDTKRGVVRNSPNFSHFQNIPLGDWVKSDFSVPATVENDANCAVAAEWRLSFQEYENIVLLTLGTGIGGGLILNGKLFRGSTGTGGELGHLSINSNGIPCPCGSIGCFERYCSASALKKNFPKISSKDLFQNTAHNPAYQQAVDEFIHHLKVGIVSIANVFDPDILLLGGAISKGITPYLDDIRGWVKEHAFPAPGAHMKIELTQHDNWSGAIGAALLSR